MSCYESLDVGANDCFYLCHSTSVHCGCGANTGPGTFSAPLPPRSQAYIRPPPATAQQSPVRHHKRRCSPAEGGGGLMGQNREVVHLGSGHSSPPGSSERASIGQPQRRRDGHTVPPHIAWTGRGRRDSQHGFERKYNGSQSVIVDMEDSK